MHLLIIGGSDAGTMAALRARELDTSADITMLLADAFPNYSVCGLPFYVSNEVPELTALAHRRASDLDEQGITLLQDRLAIRLDPAAREVTVRGRGDVEDVLRYDTVVIATGARPRVTGVRGADLPGVHPFHTMADGVTVRARMEGERVRSVAIVGGGYIGIEMADAFTHRGLHVTLVSHRPTVLPTLDPSLGALLQVELEKRGVVVQTGTRVDEIAKSGSWLKVRSADGWSATADLVLLGAGVQPNSELARDAGVTTGIAGAIRVDRRMRTNVEGVLAAGDCVETWHRVLHGPAYLPLGTTAHKQGRIAGETAINPHEGREFQGSLGTQVVKVFDLAAARTGLRDDDARGAGFDPVTVESEPWDHKVYYPGARRVHIRITGDRTTGRLLGAQIVGPHDASVAKRIDIYATALFHGMTVEGISDLDLSYTPPLGAPWDAVQEAGLGWVRESQRRVSTPRTGGK